MREPEEQTVEYFCPGRRYPISRAVHLGRLAGFYPACRQCPHRQDTGTLSARQVKRIEETQSRAQSRPLFYREGAAGVYLNEMAPATARQLAAALGVYLKHRQPNHAESPVAVIAGDGRPLAPELVAAAAEGLRWAGCHVIDLGQASAPCVAFAIEHLQCAGGILGGDSDGRPQAVGLKFWADGPQPLSTGGPLDAIRRIFLVGADRPTRSYGSLRRLQVDAPYLAVFAEHYHALRPLRVVVQSTCRPLLGYLEELTGQLACRIITCPTGPKKGPGLICPNGPEGASHKLNLVPFSARIIAERVRAEKAHFGVRIDDDGQLCRVLDEQATPLPCERLLLLLTQHILCREPAAKIVLEDATSGSFVEKIRKFGARPVMADTRRAEMYRAMKAAKAPIGGGPSGYVWHVLGGTPLPDALVTLTLLFVILSQSDRPLSEVLDARAALA